MAQWLPSRIIPSHVALPFARRKWSGDVSIELYSVVAGPIRLQKSVSSTCVMQSNRVGFCLLPKIAVPEYTIESAATTSCTATGLHSYEVASYPGLLSQLFSVFSMAAKKAARGSLGTRLVHTLHMCY